MTDVMGTWLWCSCPVQLRRVRGVREAHSVWKQREVTAGPRADGSWLAAWESWGPPGMHTVGAAVSLDG